MKTYIVKYKHHEKLFTDERFATSEAERLGKTGIAVSVYLEVDGVREEKPFFSCTVGIK